MNNIYCLVWSKARGAFVVASETAKRCGKGGTRTGARLTVTAACMVGLPGTVFAQSVVVAPGSGNTQAYAAGNGATVVNINTANNAGVSHNKFSTYNVDPKGLVLNNGNASQAERQSVLAGRVSANTNLAAPAQVILNEVVSANRSTLAGFTEVLGAKADVVVANPYGITCSGCGFINTDRVTLGTGAPTFGIDGSFTGFAVNRGDIQITGAGINATAQQILDLVTRSVKIDGPVNGAPTGTLGVVTGPNQWNYASRTVTGSTTATDAAPTYAIDSSALGGMYVGRITLTATEAGVGVRMLGEAAARASDFTLTSAGKIEIRSAISAEGNASVATSSTSGVNDLLLDQASITATAGKLDLSSAGSTTLAGGKLFAGGDLNVSGATLIDNGLMADTRFAKGDVTVTTTSASSINGTSWGADGSLKGQFDTLSIGASGATLYAGGTLALSTAGALALGAASVKSSGDMSLSTATGMLDVSAGASQGIQTTGGNLTIDAASGFDNAGSITADAGSITVRAGNTLTNHGRLQSKTNLDIAGKGNAGDEDILNDGVLLAGGVFSAKARNIANQASGMMQGAGGSMISAASLNNEGTFIASTLPGQTSTMSLASLDNKGMLQAAGNLNLDVASSLSNTGTITTDDALAITGSGAAFDTQSGTVDGKTVSIDVASLNNQGTVQSDAGMVLTVVNALTNDGTVRSGATLESRSAGLTNNGTLQATQGGSISVTGTLANTGALLVSDTVGFSATVTADTLANSSTGTVQSKGNATINVGTALNNSGDLKVAGALALRGTDGAYSVTNAKLIESGGVLDVKGQNGGNGVTISVGSTAVMHGGSVDINASAISVGSGGALQSDTSMALASSNALTNDGTVRAGTTLSSSSASLTNNGTLQGTQGGSISVSGTLSNAGNLLVSDTVGFDGTISADTLTNTGTVQSRGGATVNLATALNNSGDLKVAGALTMRGTDSAYSVSNSKLIESGGLMDVKGQNGGNGVAITVGNSGVMHGNSMDVNAGAVTVGNGGTITTDGNMTLAASSLSFGGSSSKIVAASSGSGTGTVTVGSAFTNLGAVHSGKNMSFSARSITNDANGAFSALDTLTVRATAGNLQNNGALYAKSNLVASATGTLQNNGSIDSDNAMSLTASTFRNYTNVNAKGSLGISAATFLNQTPDDITKQWSTPTYTKGTDVNDPNAVPDSVDSWYWCWADRCTTKYYSNETQTVESFVHGTPTHIPKIISGGVLSISGFTQANNTGGLLSGATKVDLNGTNFTMTPLELTTKTFKRTWERWSHWAGQGPAFYELDTLQNDSGDVLTSQPSAPVTQAGIYGAAITGTVANLSLKGSAFGASTTPKSAAGASNATLTSGANGTSSTSLSTGVAGTTVDSVPAIQFSSVTITLPTSPNGYFVLAKDPAAHYLVETNPLFQVGSSYNGSEYLQSQLTGNNPAATLRHLGDASYEAYLIREQLVAETGRNLLVAGESEQDLLKRLFANAAADWTGAGLSYGAPLTQSQQDALTRDMVWMVTAKVSGQDVLVPVVYLSKATRAEIRAGAVIAGNAIDLNVGSLDNTGGTISGKDTLKIAASGDINNISGTIEGGDVMLTSTGGSINNITYSEGNGAVLNKDGKPVTEMVVMRDQFGQPVPEMENGQPKRNADGEIIYKKTEQPVYATYNTVIGKTAGIHSTGKLSLDAAKDINVTGAQLSAGNGASLNAGENVAFNTIENRTTDTTHEGWNRKTERTTAIDQVQSGLTVASGNLDITAQKDIVLAGTTVNVNDGNATLTATTGDLKVLAREKSKQVHTESTEEGLGVGGGVWGKVETVRDVFDGTNLGSSISVKGGDGKGDLTLSAANKDITIQGSDITASGNGSMNAKNVSILEGHDVHTSTETVTTNALLVINPAANVAAKDRIDVGRDLKPITEEDKKRMYLGDINRPTQYDANGNVVAYGNEGDLKNNPPYDGSIYGQFDQVGANTVGHRKGFKTYDEATAQTDHVEAPGLTLYQNTVKVNNQEKKTSVAPKLSFGKNLTVKGSDSVTLAGANVEAKDIVLESNKVDILAGTSSENTTSSTTVNQIGLYVSADAAGKAGASSEYMTQDQVMGSAVGAQAGGNASGMASGAGRGFAKGMANGGVDVFRNNVDRTTTTKTTTTGSTLKGNNVTISGNGGAKAASLLLEGTTIDAKNDVTLSAEKLDVLAAGTRTETQTTTERHRLGLNINITGDADASAKASASGDVSAHSSPLGAGGSAGFSADASAKVNVNLEARVEVARGRVLNTTQTDTTVAGSTIHAGNQLKIDAGTLKVSGSELSGDKKVDVTAKDMRFEAAEEVHDTTSTSTKYSLGRYAEVNLGIDVSASASARASVEAAGVSANANQDTSPAGYAKRVGMAEGTVNAAGAAEISGRASEGFYGTGTQLSRTTTDHRAKVSSITSRDGDVSRTGTGTGSAISDVGTRIEAAGSFSQSADTISSKAASDYKASSLDEVSATVKVGNYVSGVAKTRVDADASIDRNQGGRYDWKTKEDPLSGDVAPSQFNRVDSAPKEQSHFPKLNTPTRSNPANEVPTANVKAAVAAGVEIGAEVNNESNKYTYQTAVASTIKAGKISSTSKGNTLMEGTKLDATASSGDAVIISAGSLDMTAAVNKETGTKTTNAGAGKTWVGVALGTSGAKDFGLTANFDQVADTDSRTREMAGQITAEGGGAVKITTTGDAKFVGTKIDAAGDTALNVGGKLDMVAAKDERTKTNNTVKVAGNITDNQATCQGPQAQSRSCSGLTVSESNENMKMATHTGGSINSGGALTINAGGAATFQSTDIQVANGIAIDGKDSVQFTNAADTRSTTKGSLDIQLNSMNGQNWKVDKPDGTSIDKENSKKWGSAKIAASQDTRSEAVVGSVNASGGNVSITSKKDLRFEGTHLDAAEGSIAVTSTDGSVNFDVARSTRLAGGIDASGGASTNTIDATTNNPNGTAGAAADGSAARQVRTGDSQALKAYVTSTTVEAGSAVNAKGGITVTSKDDLTLKGTKMASTDGDITVKSTNGDVVAGTANSTMLNFSVDASRINFDTTTGAKSQGKDPNYTQPDNIGERILAVANGNPASMPRVTPGQAKDKVFGAPPSPNRNDWTGQTKTEGNGDTRGNGGHGAVGGSLDVRKTFDGASFTAKNGSLTIESGGAQGKTTLVNVQKDVKTENIEKAGGLDVQHIDDIGISAGGKTTWNTHTPRPAPQPPAQPPAQGGQSNPPGNSANPRQSSSADSRNASSYETANGSNSPGVIADPAARRSSSIDSRNASSYGTANGSNSSRSIADPAARRSSSTDSRNSSSYETANSSNSSRSIADPAARQAASSGKDPGRTGQQSTASRSGSNRTNSTGLAKEPVKESAKGATKKPDGSKGDQHSAQPKKWPKVTTPTKNTFRNPPIGLDQKKKEAKPSPGSANKYASRPWDDPLEEKAEEPPKRLDQRKM